MSCRRGRAHRARSLGRGQPRRPRFITPLARRAIDSEHALSGAVRRTRRLQPKPRATRVGAVMPRCCGGAGRERGAMHLDTGEHDHERSRARGPCLSSVSMQTLIGAGDRRYHPHAASFPPALSLPGILISYALRTATSVRRLVVICAAGRYGCGSTSASFVSERRGLAPASFARQSAPPTLSCSSSRTPLPV